MGFNSASKGKLRVIVHGVLDRGLHNVLVGTIQEQRK